MYFEDHESWVDLGEEASQEHFRLQGGLVGGAEVEGFDAVAGEDAGVEGAVGMGGANEQHINTLHGVGLAGLGVEVVAGVGDVGDVAEQAGAAEEECGEGDEEDRQGNEEDDISDEMFQNWK